MLTFRRSLSRRALLAASVLAALPACAGTNWLAKAAQITMPFAPGGGRTTSRSRSSRRN